MKTQYWAMMTQKKYHLFYLGYHLNLYVKIDRWMNIILAVISTGSLVGLFTSDTYQKLLAVILALTQVVTAASPYLPFEKRIKELDKGIALLTQAYTAIEKDWNTINIEDSNDAEINEKLYEHVRKWEDIDGEILKRDSLPFVEKFYNKAADDNERYFNNRFGG